MHPSCESIDHGINDAIKRRQTERLCHSGMRWVIAEVREITPQGIRLDRTVAYPEGGGQEGDRGLIEMLGTGLSIPFMDTRKGPGRVLFMPEFSGLHVDTPIFHWVAPEDASKVAVGQEVRVSIDVERRNNLSKSHTASHLLWMGVQRVRPEAVNSIFGCAISEQQARFDFHVEEKFTDDEIVQIEQIVAEIVEADAPIELSAHPQEPQARYWTCLGVRIPCGGTHLSSTAGVGAIRLSKKGIGKGKQRLTIFLSGQERPGGP